MFELSSVHISGILFLSGIALAIILCEFTRRICAGFRNIIKPSEQNNVVLYYGEDIRVIPCDADNINLNAAWVSISSGSE